MSTKPRLVVLSNVLPFPRQAGQQQRVYYKLRAFRELFDVTFLVAVDPGAVAATRAQLGAHCDRAVVLPSLCRRTPAARVRHRLLGELYALRTGLKLSNYVVGKVELAAARVAAALTGHRFDLAVYEYWHAFGSVPAVHDLGARAVLDMHDVLWQSYRRQLDARRHLPQAWKRRAVRLYRESEERAWSRFDALIAINAAERDYARAKVPAGIPVFYAPMGTDLDEWPACWAPARPPRLAYYGGLGSPHNQRDARLCYDAVMPEVWRHVPEAELWLVGSHPPESLAALPRRDARVKVTGFVPRVQELLRTMSVVLCPWQGTYGFRSRVVEVMALGVPVVASPDAVDGMDLRHGDGIFLEADPRAMAATCLRLLADPALAAEQSRRARAEVEAKYSYEACYVRLARELAAFVGGAGG
jgi:glycosyltransferase involved in cell wall biosynthesis